MKQHTYTDDKGCICTCKGADAATASNTKAASEQPVAAATINETANAKDGIIHSLSQIVHGLTEKLTEKIREDARQRAELINKMAAPACKVECNVVHKVKSWWPLSNTDAQGLKDCLKQCDERFPREIKKAA